MTLTVNQEFIAKRAATPRYTAGEVFEAASAYYDGAALPADVWAKKYALRTNEQIDAPYVELTPRDSHERYAHEMAYCDVDYFYGTRLNMSEPLTREEHDEISVYFDTRYHTYLFAFDRFKYIVLQGSPMYGVGNPFVNVSISNCVVVDSPTDDVSGIMDTGKDLANLYKRRCGVGLALDSLRPESMKVNNAALSSTGAWSFAEFYSAVTRLIGQSGRRGALMLTMNILHPDILRFITMKQDLTKVTGANISVMLGDEFMAAVENDSEWVCRWGNAPGAPFEVDIDAEIARGGKWVRTEKDTVYGYYSKTLSQQTGETESRTNPIGWETWQSVDPDSKIYLRRFKAREIWQTINEMAVASGEPGLLFWDNYTANLPACCYPGFMSISTNPCVVGETKVAVADGRGEVTFAELANDGRDVPVYAMNDDGAVVVRMMRHPRMTQRQVPVVKVTLDNGESIRCTPHHRFRMRDGDYREAKDLAAGDSLRIMSRSQARSSDVGLSWVASKSEYTWIHGGKTRNKGEHRLIAGFHSGQDEIGRSLVVHHKNFDSLDNRPENLEIMTTEAHNLLHSESRKGNNNPMRRAVNEYWSEDRLAEFRTLQSQNNSGENNQNCSQISHEAILEHALFLTRSLGRRFSTKEWDSYAQPLGIPRSFSGWRKQNIADGVDALARYAALECGVDHADCDPRVVRTLQNLLSQGYDAYIDSEKNRVFVHKQCGECNAPFVTDSDHRSACLCSGFCAAALASRQNGRLEKSIATRKVQAEERKVEQVSVYSALEFALGREPRLSEWESECKLRGLPYPVGKASGTFRSYSDLKHAAADFNHKVVFVEEDGFEDVYNGTVDEFHNYFVGGFDEPIKRGSKRTVFVNTANCSEISLSPYDSCRLTSINLKNFVIDPFLPTARFDYALFEQMVALGMRIMDNVVDLEIRYLTNIINQVDGEDEKVLWNKLRQAAIDGRRTGLGMHGLADALACLKLRYDSVEAIAEVDLISRTFRDTAYGASVDLAIERGPFPVFDWELEKDNAFIKRLPQSLQDRIAKHGRRNISLLTIAPTGTVALVSRTSSSLEPQFAFFYTRRRKINPTDGTSRIDFVDQNGDKWQNYSVVEPILETYFNAYPEKRAEWDAVLASAPADTLNDALKGILPDYFVTAPDIDPLRRVEIQGVLQGYIDHGISSTLNFPKGTTADRVRAVYEEAHKKGLKGVTVYVDGSRTGVLVNTKKEVTGIVDSTAPKRPNALPCDIHRVSVDGKKWVVLVGLIEGRPYEVFGGLAEQIEIPKKYVKGQTVKRAVGKPTSKGRNNAYDLVIGDGDDTWTIKDIVSTFDDGNYAAHSRSISAMLRHGIPITVVADQLGRDSETDFFAYSRVMARVIKKYIADGEISSDSCPECKEKLVYEAGCVSCHGCGWSGKCG